MTQERNDSVVIPHQDQITMEVFHDTICITQESLLEGNTTISITGKANVELVISALQKVQEAWS